MFLKILQEDQLFGDMIYSTPIDLIYQKNVSLFKKHLYDSIALISCISVALSHSGVTECLVMAGARN